MLVDKNIVMCLTTGRSGTNLLEKMMALAPDTVSLHEPQPAFHDVLARVKKDPSYARAFVREEKLPAILACGAGNYVETSHLFGKGFFEAFVEEGIPFKLIILNRHPREVAKSLWRIKTVPARSKKGRMFLLEPYQDGVLKPKYWRLMTNYQLCFWYCLEVERRKTLYRDICARNGIPVFETSIEELVSWERFQALCAACGMPVGEDVRAQHEALSTQKINPKSKYKESKPLVSFAAQEELVWRALGEEGVALRAEVEARYAQ